MKPSRKVEDGGAGIFVVFVVWYVLGVCVTLKVRTHTNPLSKDACFYELKHSPAL